MRRALLFCAAIAFAIACGDDITEPIPDRTVATPPIAFATTTTEDGLSISTDKDDYQPGDTVHFTGYGWQPGDTLDIVLTDEPQTQAPHTWTVEVGPDGMFHDSTYVVDEGDLNVAFTLVATSRATGRSLTVNFTDSQPTQVTVTPTPQSVTPGGSAIYTVNVTMGGNNTTCTVTLSVTGLISGVTGTFGGGNPITTNANFSRTLTLSTTAAVPASTVNFTVQASRAANCQGNGTTDGNGILNVLGPATKLAFGQQPTNTVATASITPAVTVQVLDAANHLISSSASITLAIGNNPGGGTLSGTATQSAVNGVATFSGLSINKAGTGYTLTANSAPLTGATSNAFNITVGPFAQLGFTTQPGGGAPGSPISPQPVVAAQDAGGNTITTGQGSGASILLAVQTGTGSLSCTTNPVTASAGVASFAGCSISSPGTGFRLRASTTIAGNTFTVISNLFDITANNQAPSVDAGGPYSVAEGTELTLSPTVTDPDAGDVLTYAWTVNATGIDASGSCSINGANQKNAKITCNDDSNAGTFTLTLTVDDGASHIVPDNADLTVTNANPTATFNTPAAAVNEGSSFALSLTGATDASSNDVAAGLRYAFDCGVGYSATNYAGASTTASTSCTTATDGPATLSVKGKVFDKDGGSTEYTGSVSVLNVAPTATFNAPSEVPEGTAIALSLTSPHDPSSDDVTAGFHYAFDCGSGYGSATSYLTAGTSNTKSCPTTDDATLTVKGKIFDKDDGASEYTAQVTVKNVAPIVNAGEDQTGDEGETFHLSGSFTDPGADTHTWTWEYAEGFHDAATCHITDATTSLSPTITCNDDGIVYVTLTVADDDLGVGSDKLKLTIHNVAPSATALNTNSPVDEGSDITLSLAGVTDPSSIDFASLHYAFDCGAGDGFSASDYAGAGTANSATCTTNDNGTRTVKGKVFDKDGGVSSAYYATVTINNVAPTATFNAPSPVDEGSNIALSLTDAHDVSSVDEAAGFTYAFDCGDGSGYGAFGSASSKSCPTTDNGSRTVKGKIKDKDGGVTEYTGTVVINNVAPTITSWTPLADPVIIGATVNFSASFTDPGSADTHTGQYDCGSGTYSLATATTSPFGYSCTFSSIGQKTIRVKIADDDGGFDEKSYKFTVVYNFSGFFAPVDRPNTMNVSKVGQAIPLKWRLTDASGHAITDLTSVIVQAIDFSCSLAGTNDNVEEYAAGASGLQNLGDGYYQFNWKSPANYLNSCKKIALVFGAGGLGYTEKPGAYFTFKK